MNFEKLHIVYIFTKIHDVDILISIKAKFLNLFSS